MARYIDADKAVEHIRLIYCKNCNNYNGIRCRACEFDDAISEIEDYPTADVAPKSEVDELKEKLDATIAGQETLQKALAQAQSEVAREIIAEVRQALLNMILANAMGENYDMEKRFAEIEKKYIVTDTNVGSKDTEDKG